MKGYRFIDNSAKIIAEFERKKDRALHAIGEAAVSYAKKDTPVDTGRLRNSEDHKVIGNDVYIGTNVEYAQYQEFGTSRGIEGKHFLRNAAANHMDEYKQIFKKSMES